MNAARQLPLISVITVCRNSAATLARAFDSMLQQSHPSIDYVVVDGASTDWTVEIVRHYETRFATKGLRFRWISEPDQGIYDAMNKGIAMAQGEIIGILNSDDFYEPNTLQVVAQASVANPDAGILYGFLRVLVDGKELQTYRYRYEHYLLDKEMGVFSGTQHPACFVWRSVYEQIGTFDTQFPISADYDFLLRAMKMSIHFQSIDAVLSNFSWGGASVKRTDSDRLQERYHVLSKNGLLSDAESQNMRKLIKYRKYKALKERLAKRLFGI